MPVLTFNLKYPKKYNFSQLIAAMEKKAKQFDRVREGMRAGEAARAAVGFDGAEACVGRAWAAGVGGEGIGEA